MATKKSLLFILPEAEYFEVGVCYVAESLPAPVSYEVEFQLDDDLIEKAAQFDLVVFYYHARMITRGNFEFAKHCEEIVTTLLSRGKKVGIFYSEVGPKNSAWPRPLGCAFELDLRSPNNMKDLGDLIARALEL